MTSLRLQAERLTLNIDDKTTGDTIKPISVFIRRLRDIAAIEGVTASLDPSDDARDQGKNIRDRLNNPSVFVDGTRVRSKQDSPFTLQLAVKPSVGSDTTPAKPRQAVVDKGQAFVSIDKGELYELLFHNGSPGEVAVSFKIDGIDGFTFSDDRDKKTGQPQFSHFIVPAGQSLVIPGWFKTIDPTRKDNFLRFLVTE